MPNCYVYHIHLEGMSLDQGYVGISINPKERFAAHKRRRDNPLLDRVFKKYGDKLKFTILSCYDSVQDALWQEFTLRPFKNIGWNIAVGGGLPPDSKGQNNPNFGKVASKETKEKQSKARLGKFGDKNHPRARLANIYDSEDNLIAESVVIRVWSLQNGYHQAHLAATATGKLKMHKGVYARYL